MITMGKREKEKEEKLYKTVINKLSLISKPHFFLLCLHIPSRMAFML